MPDELEARFARTALGGETLGLSLFTVAPGFRIPFGHKHEGQEEVYVILRGSARIKVEDEIVEVGPYDAIRFGMDTMRDVEAGPEGVEYLALRRRRRPAGRRDGAELVERLIRAADPDGQPDQINLRRAHRARAAAARRTA
jgi:quercetin dioxygenase-like cupin family protein